MLIKTVWRMIIISALVVVLSGCGDSAANLEGTWVQVSGARPDSVLTLNADGTGQFQPRGGVAYQIDKWEAQAEYLNLEIPGYNVIAEYKLVDNLELSRVEDFEEFNGSYRKQ